MVERPWLAHYPAGVDWHVKITPRPLWDLVDAAARDYPDRPAMDFMGKRFSYRQLGEMVNQAAAGFQALGVTKGTKVGLFLPNCPQFVIAFFGVLKAGGTVVNYSPLYAERELLYQVEDSDTDLMITLDLEALYPKMAQVMRESRIKRLIVGSLSDVLPFPKNFLFPIVRPKDIAVVTWDDKHTSFRDLLRFGEKPTPVAVNPVDDVAVLQYTGGTTGTPKGAMLTHANLYVNAVQSRLWTSEAGVGSERMLGVLPFFHAFALTGVMTMGILIAAEIVMLPKFELNEVMKAIARRKPTLMAGVPTMFRAFLNHPAAKEGALRSLKACFSGGAPLPLELKRAFEAESGCKLFEGYGLTECSPVASGNPYSGKNKEGSIGLPMPATDILIVDRDDPMKELPLGEVGEIAIVGPQVMKGYWRRPDATAETIVNGRLLTGDLGRMDEEGYTYIVDREKDLILVSGYNVFPRVVEEAIYEHPSVAEAVVIGVPDPYRGEAPKAFVALKPGHNSVTADTIKEFLRPRIGKHEMPVEIEIRPSLPKTMVGKLSKKELKDEELAKRQAAAAKVS